MEKELPRGATKVVIIGGGIAGCSVAYHLAKYGWKDVVLLRERSINFGNNLACSWISKSIRSFSSCYQNKKIYNRPYIKNWRKKLVFLLV